jgi:Transposase domain (DUF772)
MWSQGGGRREACALSRSPAACRALERPIVALRHRPSGAQRRRTLLVAEVPQLGTRPPPRERPLLPAAGRGSERPPAKGGVEHPQAAPPRNDHPNGHSVRRRGCAGRGHPHKLFDDEFQAELETMYRSSGAGKEPLPPALLAMVVLLQGYHGISDAEAVEMSVVDLRWQLVLDVLGSTEPAFSQGALSGFRARLIQHDMDRRLLERTVELARRTKEFDWKKLPKELRVAVDSMPLEGAGRVEDTINLLAHAARKAISCVASLLDKTPGFIALTARAPLFAAEHSIKRALDVEWANAEEKSRALREVADQVDALETWINKHHEELAGQPPLSEHLATLRQIREQDLEPDPSGGGARIREGVAAERRVSVEDGQMRHGERHARG